MIDRPSPNYGHRAENTPIDMLVLHYTGMRDAAAALERLCDTNAKVSAHYCIDEDGTVVRLVDEEHRAWHAGVSYWRGDTDINSRSVGIELVNPGHEYGYHPFPEAQMAALIALSTDILARHPIPPRNVVAHSDIAPARKQDPGELFDWPRLARTGIGLWPEAGDIDNADAGAADFDAMLTDYGYDPDAEGVVAAFQRHFRPARIDGVLDAECRRILAALDVLIG
jgi:N-acetylmuramoyl-L-alanine amidase